MQLWTLPRATAALPRAQTTASGDAEAIVLSLITSIGHRDFGGRALECINDAVAAASWSVYCLSAQGPPVLHASGSFGIEDTTTQCFKAYVGGLYRRDASFAAANEQAVVGQTLMSHWHASEMRGAHREQIYRRHGMRERLSLIGREGQAGLIAVNFYRHEHQGGFRDAEIDLLQRAAPAVLACVRQHIALSRSGGVTGASTSASVWLLRRCPALTKRELQVCDYLLRGWSHDAIAVETGLSVTTVKTYRNRAFERLGIHFRSELFSLALRATQPQGED